MQYFLIYERAGGGEPRGGIVSGNQVFPLYPNEIYFLQKMINHFPPQNFFLFRGGGELRFPQPLIHLFNCNTEGIFQFSKNIYFTNMV